MKVISNRCFIHAKKLFMGPIFLRNSRCSSWGTSIPAQQVSEMPWMPQRWYGRRRTMRQNGNFVWKGKRLREWLCPQNCWFSHWSLVGQPHKKSINIYIVFCNAVKASFFSKQVIVMFDLTRSYLEFRCEDTEKIRFLSINHTPHKWVFDILMFPL